MPQHSASSPPRQACVLRGTAAAIVVVLQCVSGTQLAPTVRTIRCPDRVPVDVKPLE